MITVGIKGHRKYNDVKREVLKNGLEEVGEKHYNLGKFFNPLISQQDFVVKHYDKILEEARGGRLEKRANIALAFPYRDLLKVKVKVRYFAKNSK